MISLCSFLYALARTLPFWVPRAFGRGVWGSAPEETEQVVCWPQSPRSRRQPSRDWRSWENTLGGLSREALSS